MTDTPKHWSKSQPPVSGEELLSKTLELGIVDTDLVSEPHRLDRLGEVFGKLEPRLQQELQLRMEQQLDRKHSRIKAFAEHYELTAAELDLLTNLCSGLNTAQHAKQRNISKNTVRTHMQRLREKTGASRQAEVIWMALESKDLGRS